MWSVFFGGPGVHVFPTTLLRVGSRFQLFVLRTSRRGRLGKRNATGNATTDCISRFTWSALRIWYIIITTDCVADNFLGVHCGTFFLSMHNIISSAGVSDDSIGLHCGPGTLPLQSCSQLTWFIAMLWLRQIGQTHGAPLHRFRDRFSDVSIGRVGDLAIDGSTEGLKDSNLLSYLQRLRCARCIWSALRTWYNTSQTVAFR